MNFKIEFKNFIPMLKDWNFWKSVISGGTTAIVDLSLLFIFKEVLHLHYWASINISFSVAILVNFFLQKFWTFSNKNIGVVHKQFGKFFLVAIGNMAMNSFIMFVLSIVLGIWYLAAQVITIGMLVLVNFTLYRYFVFR